MFTQSIAGMQKFAHGLKDHERVQNTWRLQISYPPTSLGTTVQPIIRLRPDSRERALKFYQFHSVAHLAEH